MLLYRSMCQGLGQIFVRSSLACRYSLFTQLPGTTGWQGEVVVCAGWIFSGASRHWLKRLSSQTSSLQRVKLCQCYKKVAGTKHRSKVTSAGHFSIDKKNWDRQFSPKLKIYSGLWLGLGDIFSVFYLPFNSDLYSNQHLWPVTWVLYLPY